MSSNFASPPTGFGPGSQGGSEDDPELEYLPLPSGMRTFESRIPYIEDTHHIQAGLKVLAQLASACAKVAQGEYVEPIDLKDLDAENRKFIAEAMGTGEVSVRVGAGPDQRLIQESIFAGVWQVGGANTDYIEVARVPSEALARAFTPVRPAQPHLQADTPQIVNAPAILTELVDKAAAYKEGTEPHVINLTLLPHTPQDLDFLADGLGEGSATFLSRGYGNCRVTATAISPVWRVQHFNSMDTLILDTFEVTTIPEVVGAATEDLEDSHERILEVLEAMQ